MLKSQIVVKIPKKRKLTVNFVWQIIHKTKYNILFLTGNPILYIQLGKTKNKYFDSHQRLFQENLFFCQIKLNNLHSVCNKKIYIFWTYNISSYIIKIYLFILLANKAIYHFLYTIYFMINILPFLVWGFNVNSLNGI